MSDSNPVKSWISATVYSVIVDVRGGYMATYSLDSAYDASAVANYYTRAGFDVITDLWGIDVRNAMLSPGMHNLISRSAPTFLKC